MLIGGMVVVVSIIDSRVGLGMAVYIAVAIALVLLLRHRAVAESSLSLGLVAADKGAAWGWAGDRDALDSLLSPILSSALEVMAVAGGRPYVRQCAAEGCRLFFVDRSPSGRRRWCEKKTCGHRAANLRYYHRRGKHERV